MIEVEVIQVTLNQLLLLMICHFAIFDKKCKGSMHNMYHHVDSRSMKQLFWKIFKIYKKKSFPKFPHKKLSRIQFATVMKKRLLCRCIPVSFTKFLKTIFCRTETAKWCVFFKKGVLNPNKAGLFKGSSFWVRGVNLTRDCISKSTYLIST